jgi:hypothetical protein
VLQVMLALLDKLQTLAQWGVGLASDTQEATPPTDTSPRVVH